MLSCVVVFSPAVPERTDAYAALILPTRSSLPGCGMRGAARFFGGETKPL